MLLAYKLLNIGRKVLLPIAEEEYDLVVDNDDGTVTKVQIKSTSYQDERGRYKISLKRGSDSAKKNRTKYKAGDYDVLALYLHNECIWYILPFSEITTVTANFYPEKDDHRFSKFKENWDLLT